MGLIGMARRAGAAQGAYLAAQEAYHRQRQGLYDDMARQRFGMDQQRFDMDRQNFKNSLIDRETKNKFDAELHEMKKKEYASKLAHDAASQAALSAQTNLHNTNAKIALEKNNRDAEHYKNFGIPFAQANLDTANAKADAQDIANKNAEIELNIKKGMYKQLKEGGGHFLNMTTSGRQSARPAAARPAAPAKPSMTDSQLKNFLENATPQQMKDAFYQVFNTSDNDIKRLTGKSTDQFFADSNTSYKEHVNRYRDNSMSRQEFFEQYAKQYGFRPIYDLRPYLNAVNEDARRNPSKTGNWIRRYGQNVPGLQIVRAFMDNPYGMDKYKHENPTIVDKQTQIINEINKVFGKPSEISTTFIRDPQRVKKYMTEKDKGRSPQEAVQATLKAFPIETRGAR